MSIQYRTNTSALIQLAGAGVQDAAMNRENRNAQVNVQYSFENNELTLPRYCDTTTPLFIKSNYPIKFLEFKIGDSTIIKFPLNFCNTISNFTSQDNVYKIPWDLLNLKSIPIVSLAFSQVKFIIISDHQCDAKLYVCNYYVEDSRRRTLATRCHENLIKQFQEQEIQINEDGVVKELLFHGLIKGIFLDNIIIPYVDNIQLLFQGSPRITYDKFMIELFTHKISDTCIYIPFDNKDFNDLSLNSCINFSRIANIAIKINSNILQNITIRAFNHNILRIATGLGGLAYDFPINNSDAITSNLSTQVQDAAGSNVYNLLGITNSNSGELNLVNTHRRTNSNSGELNLVNTNNRTNSNSGELNLVMTNNSSITVETMNKILEGDSQCSIALIEIESEAEYMTCDTCNKNFLAANLQRWLHENNNCPTCRSIWTNDRTIYTNISMSLNE